MSALQEIAVDLAAEKIGDPIAHASASRSGISRFKNWFDGLSIGRKIRVFFGFNLAFALLAGLFVVLGYVQLDEKSGYLEEAHKRSVAAERLL
ncbi:MAG: hypothetical protein AAFQ27_01950, partial [Pseudomonadota bacterium]